MIIEEKGKKKRKVKCNSQKTADGKKSDLELLEDLIRKFFEKLEKNGFEPKAQDVIRAMHLKQKLAQASEKEKIFWEMIDQLRREEVGKKITNEKIDSSSSAALRLHSGQAKTKENGK